MPDCSSQRTVLLGALTDGLVAGGRGVTDASMLVAERFGVKTLAKLVGSGNRGDKAPTAVTNTASARHAA